MSEPTIALHGEKTADLITRLDQAWTRFVTGAQPQDPVLDLLTDLAAIRDTTARHLRAVLAYGRCTRPRPYTLAELADAAGISISGVRIAFSREDIDLVLDTLHRHRQADRPE